MVSSVNAAVAKLMGVPLLGSVVRRNTVMISYVGRRSGKTFTTPVSYRRNGDEIVIRVMLPDAKNWWRNFLDGGSPITLQLNGTDRTGHAVATRDDTGRVTVTIKLDGR
ncbi:nitroreductase/quinone reductase family protein [Mycobacterium ahvazicum]|nr:nitroreductase/quinone reductase family protein [Mycobacterium ahvazicum]